MRELLTESERSREFQYLAERRKQKTRGPLRSSVNHNIETALVAICFQLISGSFSKRDNCNESAI